MLRPFNFFIYNLHIYRWMMLAGMLALFAACTTKGTPPEEPKLDVSGMVNCAAMCDKTPDPVCDVNGEVYLNECLARCANAILNDAEECSVCKYKLQEYQERGVAKVSLLNEYINVILKERAEDDEDLNARVDTAINQAVGLFVNEDAQVAVTGTNTMHFKIRDYLHRIKNYSYGKVEIAWSEIGYISDLKQGQDGNYYGSVTVTQVFRGFIDNQPVYRDVTRKTIEVVLKTYTVNEKGKITLECEIFLSDIGVKDTRVY